MIVNDEEDNEMMTGPLSWIKPGVGQQREETPNLPHTGSTASIEDDHPKCGPGTFGHSRIMLGDDNEETNHDPEEINKVKNHSLQLSTPNIRTPAEQSVLEMVQVTAPVNQFQDLRLLMTPGYKISSVTRANIIPVAIVASRAVDPVGSPSSTTNDQDEQSTSTSPTNQEIQSQVTHQGVEEINIHGTSNV
ncbi:hypothetical protein Tco_0326562 [Tanacetum coccineum]